MARTRVSTTVDSQLLAEARQEVGESDSQLIDAALAALLAQRRRVVVDAAYEAEYKAHPLDEPDEWGDLASFLDATSS